MVPRVATATKMRLWPLGAAPRRPVKVRGRLLPCEAPFGRREAPSGWLVAMAPKKRDAPFPVDGVQFQRSGNVINSVRGQGSRDIMIKVPAAGWTEAQRNAKIRSTPGFAELKSSVTAAAGDQPADGESRPATQTKNAVGQREMRAVREVDAPMEESRSRVQTKVFMHSEYSERDDHDARRVGSRHAKVRDVSYAEARGPTMVGRARRTRPPASHKLKKLIY